MSGASPFQSLLSIGFVELVPFGKGRKIRLDNSQISKEVNRSDTRLSGAGTLLDDNA